MICVQDFFDKDTSTLTYVVYDPLTLDAVVIDPVLDFDPLAWKISYGSAKKIIEFVDSKKLKLHFLLETHAHADHISASSYLQSHYPLAKIAIGQEISQVQKVFKDVYHLTDLPTDGSQFDELYRDGKILQAGSLKITCLHTPGHTPACYSLLIAEHLFTGDCLFAPDLGTGRCDFPGGDAKSLYRSIQDKVYHLPDSTILHSGHDYPSSRELCTSVSLGEMKSKNVKITVNTSEQSFILDRQTRDKTLSLPKLIYQSLFINIRAGQFPERESNGGRYFKIPLTE